MLLPLQGDRFVSVITQGGCPGLGASALYLCFTLRPAIFNSLRPVTVGSGRLDAIYG